MRILVLGGGGFLGSALVEDLAKVKSNRIQVLDSFTHGFPKQSKPKKNVEPWVSASITDVRNLLRVMERFKPEVVFHLAAVNNRPESFSDFRTCAEVNYSGTANVIHAVTSLSQRPKKLIFASTLAAEDPQSHFGISKLAAEQLILSTLGRFSDYGVQPHILRFGEIYGQSATYTSTSLLNFLVDKMLAGSPMAFYSVQESIDCLHISDAVAACKILAGANITTPRMDIGTGNGIRILDLINKVKALTNYDAQLRFLENEKVPVRTYIADTALAREVLGFSAQVDLDQALADLVKKRRKIIA